MKGMTASVIALECLLLFLCNGIIQETIYVKVSSAWLPQFVSNCYQQSHFISLTTGLSLRLQCSTQCNAIDRCKAFCVTLDNAECHLYSLHLSKRYNLSGSSPTDGHYYEACYSSWALPVDVILPNSPINGTPPPTNYPANTVDRLLHGIYCYPSVSRVYIANGETEQFIMIELPIITSIKYVEVAIYAAQYFLNAQVRLGNSTDLKSNPLLGQFMAEHFFSGGTAILPVNAVLPGKIFSVHRSPVSVQDLLGVGSLQLRLN